jgi:hypothetical protein
MKNYISTSNKYVAISGLEKFWEWCSADRMGTEGRINSFKHIE